MTDSRSEKHFPTSVDKLRQEFDGWLETAVEKAANALDAFGWRGATGKSSPPIDLIETSDGVRVLVDLPGIDTKSIDISLAGNMLTLSGESPDFDVMDSDQVHLRERSRGSFRRSVPMPVPVNPDDVSAELKEGLLQIRLMKTEERRPRQIHVTQAEEREDPSTS